jgi:hypothetical protein
VCRNVKEVQRTAGGGGREPARCLTCPSFLIQSTGAPFDQQLILMQLLCLFALSFLLTGKLLVGGTCITQKVAYQAYFTLLVKERMGPQDETQGPQD